jgi:hypothetical protein
MIRERKDSNNGNIKKRKKTKEQAKKKRETRLTNWYNFVKEKTWMVLDDLGAILLISPNTANESGMNEEKQESKA